MAVQPNSGLSITGTSAKRKKAIDALVRQLDTTYHQVVANFDDNGSVDIDISGKRLALTITNIDRLDNPPSLQGLSKQVEALVPTIDFTELLLEINAHTGFADEFTHISESNARATDLTVSICAVLVSEACNIRLIKSHIPALTRHRLCWVKQNYLRAETLVKANAKLVDFQSTLALGRSCLC